MASCELIAFFTTYLFTFFSKLLSKHYPVTFKKAHLDEIFDYTILNVKKLYIYSTIKYKCHTSICSHLWSCTTAVSLSLVPISSATHQLSA